MMAINRYRLRHQAKQGNKTALLIEKLLSKTDQLIGTILIGNNFVNILATMVATVLATRWLAPYLGNLTELVTAILITFIFLLFAEVTPKTIAASAPEKVAFPASYLLYPIGILLFPGVWLVTKISQLLLLPFRSKSSDEEQNNNLSPDELRTVVDDAGALIPRKHQKMLINILDLEKVTIDEIMIPKHEVAGIDIEEDISEILDQLTNNLHTRLPVYRGDLNDVIGIVHMRNVAKYLSEDEFNKSKLMQLVREPYFVPAVTPLNTQLINFQKQKRRIGMVVNEYGDVIGLVTLEDILEEIVGEFTTNLGSNNNSIFPQEDGSYMVDGSITVRELNRLLKTDLPISHDAKTLNGFMLAFLGDIPAGNVALKFSHWIFETSHVENHRIRTIRVIKEPEGIFEQAVS